MDTKPCINICLGSSCFARGNEQNAALIEAFIARRGLRDEVDLSLSGSLCLGRCADGPIVVINDVVYSHVTAAALRELLEKLFPEKSEEEN